MAHKQEQTRPLGPNGFRYRPQYGLVVVCRDERHQAQLFKQLQRDGQRVRVVVV